MQDVDISVLLCIDGYAAQQVAGPTFVARNSRMRPPDSCHDFAGLDRKGDDLRREVLQLSPAFAWIDFGYVLRRKNQIAHRLAGIGRTKEPISASSPLADLGGGAQR